MSSVNWMNRERSIHEKVFDTLSRPLSRATDKGNNGSSGMFSGTKVRWNHFGKKYTLRISDYEMEYADLMDAFMKKVHEVRPDFEGALAYIDQYGRQVLVSSDRDLRDALTQTKNKLKLHSTINDGVVISAAEMAGRPTRSQSVPPARSYNNYPPNPNSRSPSSMDSAPATYRNRMASPPPPSSPHSQSMQVKTTYSTAGSYSGYRQMSPSSYSYGPYSQNLLYGMPPHNGMLLRFLANPFPFGSYHRSFIGPNKYHHFGGWGGRYAGYGPVW